MCSFKEMAECCAVIGTTTKADCGVVRKKITNTLLTLELHSSRPALALRIVQKPPNSIMIKSFS